MDDTYAMMQEYERWELKEKAKAEMEEPTHEDALRIGINNLIEEWCRAEEELVMEHYDEDREEWDDTEYEETYSMLGEHIERLRALLAL